MAENKTYKFIFPNDTSETIVELTKKHGIREDVKEFAIKSKKGEDLNCRKILLLLKELQDSKLDEKNLSAELQTRLKIPKTKANNLAEDIHEKFLQPKPIEEKTAAPIPEKPALKSKQKKETSTDVYRELIE